MEENTFSDWDVVDAYREIAKADFPHLGVLETPEFVGEGYVCRDTDFLRLFIHTKDGKIEQVRYQCLICDPPMYVTVETLASVL